MYVFYRRRSAHPFDPALTDMEAASEFSTWALARNLRFDHRVSKERELTFLAAFGGTPPSLSEFDRVARNCFKADIQRTHRPQFLDRSLNHENILDPPPPKSGPIMKDTEELVTVLDLACLRESFNWAKDPRFVQWRKFVKGFSMLRPELLSWLDGHLRGKREAAGKAFLKTAFEIANAHAAATAPHNPMWVTTWRKFAPHMNSPQRWPKLVGCHKGSPCWLVVLKYTVAEAGGLVRPTQLDAGPDGIHHYPSPPRLPAMCGGNLMDLAERSPKRPPICEYIHARIALSVQHVVGMRRIDGNAKLDLPWLRERHYKLLAGYNRLPRTWTP